MPNYNSSGQTATEIFAENGELRRVLDSLHVFVGVLTPDGIMIECNNAPIEAAGQRREDVIGTHFAESFWWNYSAASNRRIRRDIERAARGEKVRYDARVRVRCEPGETQFIEVDFALTPMFDEAGKVTHLIPIGVDISERKKLENKLKENEDRFQLAFAAAQSVIYDWNIAEDQIIRAGELKKLLGFDSDESGVANSWFQSRLHPEDAKRAAGLVKDAIASGAERFEDEYRLRHRDGHYVWVRDSGILLKDTGGKITRCVGSIRNIDHRRRAEEALKESEERFAKAFNSSPLIVTITSLKTGKLIEVNETFVSKSGYSRAEAIGKTTSELGFWEESVRLAELAEVQKKGRIRNFEYNFKTRAGVPVVGLLSAELLEIGGEPCALTVIQDITEREQAEQALRESENQLKFALKAGGLGNWRVTLPDFAMTCSDSCRENFGVAANEEFSYSVIVSMIHAEDRVKQEAAVARALETGEEYSIEYRITTPQGEARWIDARGRAAFDDAGKPLFISGTTQNITERKRREANLAFLADLQTEFARLARVGEICDAACRRIRDYLKLSNCLFVEINEIKSEATVLHDCRTGETASLIGAYRLEDFHNAEECAALADGNSVVIDNVRDGRSKKAAAAFESLGICSLITASYLSDGRWAMALSAQCAAPRAWADDERVLLEELAARIYLRLERARAEEKLRESEERLNLALKGADLGAWDWNIQTGEVVFSERTAEIVGFTLEEINPKNRAWETLVHPDDQSQVEELMTAHLDGKTRFYESVHRIRAKTGEYKWILDRGRVFQRDANGKPLRVAGTYLDITQPKIEELNQKLLLRLGELIRESEDVSELFGAVARLLGERLAAARCLFNEIDLENRTATVRAEFRRADLPPLAATISLEKYSEKTRAEVAQGKTVVVNNTATDERTAPWFENTYRREQVGAYLVVPLLRERLWKAALLVSADAPREWQDSEISLIETVAERTWLAAEKLRGEKHLRESEERLRVAEEAAKGFNYEWNIETGAVTRSESIERVLGYRRDDLPTTWLAWADLMHPDDRIVLTEAEAVEFLYAMKDETFSGEYRARHKDGHYIWLMERGMIIRDKQGNPKRVIGQTMDVTERKEAQEKLLAAERRAARDYQKLLARIAPLAETLGTARELIVIYRELLKFIRLEMPCDGFFVSFYDAQEEARTAAYVWADDVGEIDVTTLPPINLKGAQGPNARAVREGKTIIVENYQTLIEGNRQVVVIGEDDDTRPQSSAAAPMIVKGNIIGTIETQSYQKSAFTGGHKIALEMAASLAAVAIENARLMQIESRARAEAEAANRLKDEFLATVSHELRTPLNAMLGWATIARRSEPDAEIVSHALEVIERSAQNQNQIISDILDVSRIVTGKLHLNLRPLLLSWVVGAAIDTVRPSLDVKNIRLGILIETDDEEMFSGDADRLQQIVWNLLSNAVKFTPENGGIEVALRYFDSCAEIVVSDTGEGIAPEFLPFVFDRFRQADGKKNRRHGGLGLGLAVVRHLTEMHGGQVSVASEGLGRGASFSVRLPFRKQKAQHGGGNHSGRKTVAAFTARRNAPPRLLENLIILVVDDQPDALELTRFILAEQGAEVFAAGSVDEALAVFDEGGKFDAIISDIGMPEKDGFVLMRELQIRFSRENRQIPALALTAYAAAKDGLAILEAGFHAHLAKPFEPDELVKKIAGLTSPAAAKNAND